MKAVIKWRELEKDLMPEDVGVPPSGTPISVNLTTKRVLYKVHGDYKAVKLSKDAEKLVRSVVRGSDDD